MYGMLEPDEGSFVRGGSPWKAVPYAAANTDIVKKDDVVWKIQGTLDEGFVYVRFEAASLLPAAGSKVKPEVGKVGKTGGLPPPPPMRIRVSVPTLETPKEYSISVSALVVTTDGTDAKGKPLKTYAINYSLFVKNAEGDEVFESTLGDGASSHLVAVRDRFIDVRIPLGAFGADLVTPSRVDMEEADSLLRVLPYHMEAIVAR
jgi:hypothetical protein